MSDEVYRQRRVNPQENPLDVLAKNAQIRAGAQGGRDEVELRGETPRSAIPQAPGGSGVTIEGNMPPELKEMMAQDTFSAPPDALTRRERSERPSQNDRHSKAAARRETLKANHSSASLKTSDELKGLLEEIQKRTFNFDEIYLPSRGIFYDGENGPQNGVLHLRPMSGKEEEILATPRWAKSGKAINMIIEACMREKFDVNGLLTADRTYLILFLRGISYGPDYDVEIKCPSCSARFSHVVNLNSDLVIDECPDNFSSEQMEDHLPTTGLRFGYHLSTGYDDDDIQKYRERNAKFFGDKRNDDTLTERITQLTDYIDAISNKREIKVLIEQLPVSDVNYIRNVINDPPFGVDTKVSVICPMCYEEFSLELPMETNFFFPRRVRAND